jgi:hypothetical protein
MVKNSLILALVICTNLVFAQESEKKKMMIVPYAMNMYLSDIDDQLVSISGYTPLQVKRQTRMGAEKSVYLAGANLFEITTLANLQDDSVLTFLDGVHKSVSYDYKLMPIKEEVILEDNKAKETMTKTLGKLKGFANKVKNEVKGEEQSSSDATINDGQLVVETKTEERFMATNPINPTLFEQMNDFASQHYFLFLNQLDLTREMVINAENGQREKVIKAKLHYSLFDAEGKLIEEGAAISYNKAQIKLKDDYYHVLFPDISHQMELIFNKLNSTLAN